MTARVWNFISLTQKEMEPKKPEQQKPKISPDWFVQGILTRAGDIFDNLTGRKWQPSSSLATSELVDKLTKLLDDNLRDLGAKGKFVPHNIKLKMQWDKFSGDETDSLKKLETELLSAAVDYINDRHYHTFEPLNVEIKTDYFTEGVQLSAGFDQTENEPEAAVNVTVPQSNKEIKIETPAKDVQTDEIYLAVFTIGALEKSVKLHFKGNQRINIGRGKENDLVIDDASVSKIHAVLFIDTNQQLTIADTGSTNGTFLDRQRISYGRSYPLTKSDEVSFGTVEVKFERQTNPTAVAAEVLSAADDGYQIGEFNFKNSREFSNSDPINASQVKTEVLNSADVVYESDEKL